MGDFRNTGTVVGGSVGDHAAVSGGTGARAEATSASAAADMATLLQQLKDAIASGDHHVANRDELLATAASVELELQTEEPNRLTVCSLLAGIQQAAGSAAHIASAAAALKAVFL